MIILKCVFMALVCAKFVNLSATMTIFKQDNFIEKMAKDEAIDNIDIPTVMIMIENIENCYAFRW